MSEQKKLNVVPVVMMFLLFAMIAFVTNLCNPMGVIVKSQFHLSNFEAQLGNLANFIAYLVMGIPSGLLLKKIGYKNTALLAIALGFIGVFLEYVSGWDAVQSFWVYLLGAFIAGFCMCMLNTVVNPMLNTLGGGGNRGNQLIQFGGVCNSLAATTVTIFGGALIGTVTKDTAIKDVTPALFTALAIFAVVFLVLLLVKIPEPATNTSKESATTGAFKYTHFNLGILAIFLYMGVEVGFPTYVLQYLSTPADAATPGLGVSAAIAGTIAGVYWLFMLVGRFIGGLIGGKVSSRAQITVVASLVLLCTLIGMFGPEGATINIQGAAIPVCILAFVVAGLFTSVMWGGIFNMAVEGLGKYTEFASGMFMTMVFGGALLVPFQGYLADVFQSFRMSYILVLICAAYILFYALVGSRVKKTSDSEAN
jgi:FHS family L-fucose permease-like MFS transporter